MSDSVSDKIALRRSGSGDLSQYLFGKVQPQARDLEEAVLGAILVDGNAFETVSPILKPESFYVDAHKDIYEACEGLYNQRSPIDLLTVTEALRKAGKLEQVGGTFFITELTNNVTSTANIEYHARIVAEKYLGREIIMLGQTAIKDGYDETEDVFTLLGSLETRLLELGGQSIRSEPKLLTSYLKGFKTSFIDPKTERLDSDVAGLPTGLDVLDLWTGGWVKQDLVLIAGRPGMGKTGLAITGIRKQALLAPIALFTLDMSTDGIMLRIISQEAQVEISKIKHMKMDGAERERVNAAIKLIESGAFHLHVDPTTALNTMEFRSKCKRLVTKHGVQAIYVDYLQRMKVPKARYQKDQEVTEIGEMLKLVAQENDIPVIALSQLSRASEQRGGKDSTKPRLSDLRASGSLEEIADIVLFPYRADYYKGKDAKENIEPDGIAELIIAKQRNGKIGEPKVKFVAEFGLFEDIPENKKQDDQSSLPF